MHLPLLKAEIENITADIEGVLQSEALLMVWLQFVFENFQHCLTTFSAHLPKLKFGLAFAIFGHGDTPANLLEIGRGSLRPPPYDCVAIKRAQPSPSAFQSRLVGYVSV